MVKFISQCRSSSVSWLECTVSHVFDVLCVNVEGVSHSRTFFSRTNPAAAHETVDRAAAKLDTDKLSVAASSGENGTSAPQQNFAAAGNSHRGGQRNRFTRDGRGRSNFPQQNGFRKPAPSQSAGDCPPALSDGQQATNVAGKTQQNSVGDCPPSSSSSEIPSSRQDEPLPQRSQQQRSKDQPSTVESAETWCRSVLLVYIVEIYISMWLVIPLCHTCRIPSSVYLVQFATAQA